MNKQAVLVIAHKNSYVLETNLRLLDSPYIDIFIHVDAKCSNFNFEYYKEILRYSKLIYVKPRIKVYWAGYSQVQVELILLQFAQKYSDYSYYHLISGQDLLIKPVDEFINFFTNSNKLFLESRKISKTNKWSKKVYYRVSVKHIFIKYVRYPNKLIQYSARLVNKLYAYLQVKIGIDLVKKNQIALRYGSQWFSLPDDCVSYILSKKNEIDRNYKNSWLIDEIFIQSTVAENKKLQARLALSNKREIKWLGDKDAHPYVWREKDFNKLINSKAFFARKFDENVDKKIIDEIYKSVKREK